MGIHVLYKIMISDTTITSIIDELQNTFENKNSINLTEIPINILHSDQFIKFILNLPIQDLIKIEEPELFYMPLYSVDIFEKMIANNMSDKQLAFIYFKNCYYDIKKKQNENITTLILDRIHNNSKLFLHYYEFFPESLKKDPYIIKELFFLSEDPTTSQDLYSQIPIKSFTNDEFIKLLLVFDENNVLIYNNDMYEYVDNLEKEQFILSDSQWIYLANNFTSPYFLYNLLPNLLPLNENSSIELLSKIVLDKPDMYETFTTQQKNNSEVIHKLMKSIMNNVVYAKPLLPLIPKDKLLKFDDAEYITFVLKHYPEIIQDSNFPQKHKTLDNIIYNDSPISTLKKYYPANVIQELLNSPKLLAEKIINENQANSFIELPKSILYNYDFLTELLKSGNKCQDEITNLLKNNPEILEDINVLKSFFIIDKARKLKDFKYTEKTLSHFDDEKFLMLILQELDNLNHNKKVNYIYAALPKKITTLFNEFLVTKDFSDFYQKKINMDKIQEAVNVKLPQKQKRKI